MYLPQYHPIPENDEWWGKGFTEWTNVVKAEPRFSGHYQPHLPADLGFYDLRLTEARLAQEAMARLHGIHGFCYYHYWFNGRRLLEQPLHRKLMNPDEDLPFMLCWANENWTRAWDGGQKHVLLEQNYSATDDVTHVRHLLKYFEDPRYIRVNGKPVFVIYKPELFPDIRRTITVFREEAQRHGVDMYIAWFERWTGWGVEDTKGMGFDAAIEFQPLSRSLKDYVAVRGEGRPLHLQAVDRLDALRRRLMRRLTGRAQSKKVRDSIVDYDDFISFDSARQRREGKVFPGVCPMWDNSSRRIGHRATIFKNSTPESFQRWFQAKSGQFIPFGPDENFIFINAWNEWAEGNHLEPCQRWGLRYLQAISSR